MKDQREVGPLSRGMMLRCTHSLSAPLQGDLRLLPPPVPALRWARLAVCCPVWAQDGLPTFRLPAWMGEALPPPPVAVLSAMGEGAAPRPVHRACWRKPLSICGLDFLTTFRRRSQVLALPSDPSSRTALMLAVAISPDGVMPVPQDEATVSPALHTAG
jgi:hypothetical protein